MARIDDAVRRILTREASRTGCSSARVRPQRLLVDADVPRRGRASRGGARGGAQVARAAAERAAAAAARAQRAHARGRARTPTIAAISAAASRWRGRARRATTTIVGGTSIWEGIQAVAPNAELSEDGSAADARAHDVAIVVIGERPYAEGMGDIRPAGTVDAGSEHRRADVANLAPYGQTLELAHAASGGSGHDSSRSPRRGFPWWRCWCRAARSSWTASSRRRRRSWPPGCRAPRARAWPTCSSAIIDFTGTLPFTWPRLGTRWARGFAHRRAGARDGSLYGARAIDGRTPTWRAPRAMAATSAQPPVPGCRAAAPAPSRTSCAFSSVIG